MSRTATFSMSGNMRFRPKPICRFASMEKEWSGLEGQYIRICRCHAAPSFPGCIEDFRCKKVVCGQYTKP